MFSLALPLLSLYLSPALAATAEQWRSRSIYQIITDRFALPQGADLNACDPGKQTWCGGTWNTIRENLDYVQNAGFTAIWISPVNQNYEGPRSAYGDPYHGYWMADVSKLNDRFGTADDLKALSAELHKRDMYLMVDVVVNNVMATSLSPDYSTYMFKDSSMYHPYCPIQWGNTTSEQHCWLGDEKVPLPDLDTTNPTVISQYGDWIQDLVKEYDIDGLRIDGAHVQMDFWPGFCAKAGVFCMGEVFGGIDIDAVSMYQGPQSLDSVLNYPLYTALVSAFQIPGPGNMTALADVIEASKSKYTDTGLLGNFLENQDLPRWHNLSVDPQSMYNAMTVNFMTDGIPVVYYGQEQLFSGGGDPYNREALWPSSYEKTYAYGLMSTLNQLRNFLANTTDWLKQETNVLTTSPYGMGIMKGSVISIVTNIGSPPQNGTHIAVATPFDPSTPMTNILTCQQWAVGSQGMVEAQYTAGGVPVIIIPSDHLAGSGICGAALATTAANGGKADKLSSSASSSFDPRQSPLLSITLHVLSCSLMALFFFV
ncbi:glycoside hydrolase family 13 protein [Crucibulum laeve]|uniref:alpha-amylase n=1 Tax=Crucibulum laeve TaxID=68775 RepID=A0A5C3MDR3_9AGAR|nr:glycoside hydrolase family 13 protein [Crucibulum laeve]